MSILVNPNVSDHYTPLVPISNTPLKTATFQIAIYDGFYSPIPVEQPVLSFVELLNRLTNGDAVNVLSDKASGTYFTGPMKAAPWLGKTKARMDAARAKDPSVPFEGIQRSASHSIGGQVFKFDLDDVPKAEFKRILTTVQASGVAFVVFTTFRHGESPDLMRARLIVFADRLMPPKEYAQLSEWLGVKLLGRTYDKSEHYAYQQAGFWMCPMERKHLAKRQVSLGGMVDADAIVAQLPRETVLSSVSGVRGDVSANDALGPNLAFSISRNRRALEGAINALDADSEEDWRWVLKANLGAQTGAVVPAPSQEELSWLWDTSMTWSRQSAKFEDEAQQLKKMASQQFCHPRALFEIARNRGWKNPGEDRYESIPGSVYAALKATAYFGCGINSADWLEVFGDETGFCPTKLVTAIGACAYNQQNGKFTVLTSAGDYRLFPRADFRKGLQMSHLPYINEGRLLGKLEARGRKLFGDCEKKIAKHIKDHSSLLADAVQDHILVERQFSSIALKVDPFTEKASIRLADNRAHIVLPHFEFPVGDFNEAIVRDFKEHWPMFDEFLELLAASRFAAARKKAYVWLHASSDWGKGFLEAVFSNLGLVVSLSISEIEKLFGGGPVGRQNDDFQRAWILLVNEFRSNKAEVKMLEQNISFSPKNQPVVRAELYLKLFTSAEAVESLASEDAGIEDQFRRSRA